MAKRVLIVLAVVGTFSLILTGCMPGDGAATPAKPAGFFWGIWHGWIAPLSLIGEIFFNRGLHIYETYNTGWTYDIGFYMAVISGFGGLSLARRRRSR